MLKPDTLWQTVIARTKHAQKCGALVSIPTQYELIEQDGICFIVRILSNLVRKDEAKQQQNKPTANSDKEFNPFLPYDEDLFVADISNTHVCILNKFNVVDHHLLIVTREFEEQESWLTLPDFEAMWITLAQIDGLVFYNSGKTAGASQRHKHLQLVPLPLAPAKMQIPIEPLLEKAQFQNSIGTIAFPFLHAFARLDPSWVQSPSQAAALTLECYRNLVRAVKLINGDKDKPGAYNLLATRRWILIVPRSQEYFDSISINSLGFAGALLVRNEQQMQLVKDYGPMRLLSQVGVEAK